MWGTFWFYLDMQNANSIGRRGERLLRFQDKRRKKVFYESHVLYILLYCMS
jgi:hypothetical protein